MALDDYVRRQSVDEWLAEYGGEPAPSTTPAEPILIYDTHRTTKNGHLVLAFIDKETGEEVCAFFNVDVTIQRGANKGKSYRTGHRGQFLPKPRSKFRKFWMDVVGTEPNRWAKVYKELRPRLKDLELTAEVTTAYTAYRTPFQKAENLRLREEQKGNNLGTTWEQRGNSKREQGFPLKLEATRDTDEPKCTATKVHNNTLTLSHYDTADTSFPSTNCIRCAGEGCDWCE